MGDNKNKREQLRDYMHLIERQAGTVVRPYREDGFVNVLNKYGTQKDTTEHYYFQGEAEVTDDELISFYTGNGLFAKVIDAPAEEAIKHGFEIDGLENQTIREFYMDVLDELDWDEVAIQCIKWTRLFGGALAVMLIDDGHGLEEPLDWNHIRSIDDIRIYDRSSVYPDMSSIYSTGGYGDAFHKSWSKLGMPEFYDIYSTTGSFRVHESRCLVFKNGVLPERAQNSIYKMWGVPEYLRIHRSIRDAEVAHGSAVKLLDRSIQAVYSMKGLGSTLATQGGEEMVLRRLQTIDMARGLLNSITIDADGEDYSFRQFSYSGVSEVIDTTCNYVSALTNIPQTILFGRSPAGMNATGNGDLENWYNYVERIQTRMVRKNLRYLLNVIFQAAVNIGELEEKDVPKVNIKFSSLWSLSEQEQIAVDQQKAQVAQTKAATAATYVEMQVLDPSEVRKKLAESDDFEIETMLDDYTEEELEENAPQPQGQGMPGGDPMAAMMGGGNPMAGAMPQGGEPEGAETDVQEQPEDNPDEQSAGQDENLAPEDAVKPEKQGVEAKNEPKEEENKEEEEIAEDEAEIDSVGVLVVYNGMVLNGTRIGSLDGFGKICGPGGHIEDGESSIDAAIRETKEEFGITPIKMYSLGAADTDEYGNTPEVFLCTQFDGVVQCNDGEMKEPKFSSLKGLLEREDKLFSPFKTSLSMMLHALYDREENNDADDEEKHVGNGGNTKLPYGLCKENGIDTTGMSPSEAWSAFTAKTGVSADQAYSEHFKKSPSADRSVSEELKPLDGLEDAESYEEFTHKNLSKLKPIYKEKGRAGLINEYTKYELSRSNSNLHEIDEDEADEILYDNVGQGEYDGWFREANSKYKPRLVNEVTSNPEVRNACLNLMYQNYKNNGGDIGSYEEFLTTPVEMYRGGHGQEHMEEDVFSAYSFDRKIAEKFANEGGGDAKVYTAKIRPIDTFGSLNTIGESEIWVPSIIAPNGNKDEEDVKKTVNVVRKKPDSPISLIKKLTKLIKIRNE